MLHIDQLTDHEAKDKVLAKRQRMKHRKELQIRLGAKYGALSNHKTSILIFSMFWRPSVEVYDWAIYWKEFSVLNKIETSMCHTMYGCQWSDMGALYKVKSQCN